MSKKDFLNSLTDLCNNNITFIPNKKTEKVSENDKPEDKKETVEQPKSKKSKKKNKKSMVDKLIKFMNMKWMMKDISTIHENTMINKGGS